MNKLINVCKLNSRKITLIEDAAHAFGAKYNGRMIGSISDLHVFLQSTKHLTTGDGGAIVAKNIHNYNKIKRLKWFLIDRFKDNQNFLGERV